MPDTHTFLSVKRWTFCIFFEIFLNWRYVQGSTKRIHNKEIFRKVAKKCTWQNSQYETKKKIFKIRKGSKYQKTILKENLSPSKTTLWSKLVDEITKLKIVKQVSNTL